MLTLLKTKKKDRCLGENTEGLKCDNEKKLVKVT